MTSRRFNLYRKEDVTGMSGCGIIAEGSEYSNGYVSLTWMTPHISLTWFTSIHELRTIHGHGGKTVVQWIDKPSPDDIEEILEKKE